MKLKKQIHKVQVIFAALFISTIVLGKQRQANFVLILADDLGYADLGFTGSTQIKTPNIDALAKSGVIFTQAYVSSAVCSPSRAGIMTGINQVSFGHDNNIDVNQAGHDPEFLGLPIDQRTIANHLKELGYTTGIMGKWHLGEKDHFHPLNRGFDEMWGYTGGGHDYFKSLPDGEGYLCPIECNYKKPQKITYITDDLGDECVEFIERHKQKPFFLFASFNAPHAPMQARKEDLELYSRIENMKRRTYAAMVHRLDVNVGKILSAIEKEELSSNTFIVFLSDNGGPVNANASNNAPFNGQKGILLEGGIHVPYIMRWPGVIPEADIYKSAVSSLDIAPTFIKNAGGEIVSKGFNGVDLIPFINRSRKDQPHDHLKWRFTISAAIRSGDWKLIRLPDRFPMLYHLPTDVSEQNNVAMENQEVATKLLKELGDWDVGLPHPVFHEGAKWKKTQLKLYDSKYQLAQPK